jgi:hypothetical protein
MARDAAPRTPAVGRPALVREIAVVVSAILLYFLVRGLTAERSDAAVAHAHALVAWEVGHGVYVEPTLQGLIDGSRWPTAAMNWVYIWGHWPVITVTLLWLVRHHPHGYRVTRNAMLLSGAIGLVVFARYPLAPPRLADLGLVDTVSEYSRSYRVLQPHAFVNQYAAMPSLHVGWDLLIGLALIQHGRRRVVRVAGAVLPVLMVAAVLTTANHYVADATVGALLVLACLALVRRRDAVPAGAPVPAALPVAHPPGPPR